MKDVKSDIQTLYELRKKYIEESNYIKAEEISKKINIYKSIQIKKQQRLFAQKKEIEQNNFEKDYGEELSRFTEKWSKVEEEFKNEIKSKKAKLKERQKNELNEFLRIINEREIKQKISPNYLNLKKVEAELVKQERFLEAEQIKNRAEKLLKQEYSLMEIESEQTKKKEIELFKKRQKEELTKSNEENKKKLYLIQKNKDKSKDKIINKYRARKVEMMLRQKDEEFIAKKMLQKAFRSGKRSMSQETRTTYNASNYFK